MRSFFRAFLTAAAVACWVHAAWAGEERHIQLAAGLCAGLVAHMSGEPAQPFVFRSYEPPDDASPLHPALENAGFTYDNALAVMALYACASRA